jgi:hypothetical protein
MGAMPGGGCGPTLAIQGLKLRSGAHLQANIKLPSALTGLIARGFRVFLPVLGGPTRGTFTAVPPSKSIMSPGSSRYLKLKLSAVPGRCAELEG